MKFQLFYESLYLRDLNTIGQVSVSYVVGFHLLAAGEVVFSTDEFTRVLVPVIYKGPGHNTSMHSKKGVHLKLTKVICKSNQSTGRFGDGMNCP